MDSLLIVLTVIAVIMILVGVARMRSKRNQGWEEVDHSVLFNKEDQKPAAETPREHDLAEETLAEELEQLSTLVRDEHKPEAETAERQQAGEHAGSAPGSAVARARHGAQSSRREAKKIRTEEAKKPVKFSFLEKLVGDKHDDEEEALDGAYRQGAPEWVIVLNVMAHEREVFAGPAFFNALEENGWRFGEMDIFHYSDNGVPLFSLVNMVKPGTFDPSRAEQFRSPGVSLFIRFPNEYGNGLRTFNMMLDMAQILAARLGGEVRDERRSVLTHSAIDHMREQIAAYDLKWCATASH